MTTTDTLTLPERAKAAYRARLAETNEQRRQRRIVELERQARRLKVRLLIVLGVECAPDPATAIATVDGLRFGLSYHDGEEVVQVHLDCPECGDESASRRIDSIEDLGAVLTERYPCGRCLPF